MIRRVTTKKLVAIAALVATAAVGATSLLIAGVNAPGAIAAGTTTGDVKVSNTETVQVLMDAAAKVQSKRVYEQVVLTGNGKVDIANPVSTDGLRNLDGFGGYDVRDGKVRVKTDVSGTKKYRSVSNFDKKLPLDIWVAYFLNSKEVKPGDVVGKDGELRVIYRVTNNTGVMQDVPFKDGHGKEKTSQESVVIPMVGTLTTTLPSNFTKVTSAEANAAGDGKGGTSLSFTMTLFPPIGKNYAEFGYTANVTDGIVPAAVISALPINPLESPSFKGGAKSYKAGAETGADLTAGATKIDANLLKLRDGANELVSGLLQLQDGANQLSAGLNNDAAPGAKKLADGADQLNAGAKKLSNGTGDLSGGAAKLDAGAGLISDGLAAIKAGVNGNGTEADPGLIAGTRALSAGITKVSNGLATLRDTVNSGVGTANPAETSLRGGVAKVLAGMNGVFIPGLQAVIDGALNPALAIAGGVVDPTQKAKLQGLINAAITNITNLKNGLAGQVVPGLNQVDAGLVTLNTKVAGGINTQLLPGLDQLQAGADKLKGSAPTLVGGVNDLSDGANQLKRGTSDLIDGAAQLNDGAGALSGGTDQLSAGANKLASGLGTAASGSSQLSAGLNKAAGAAPALSKGAQKLRAKGTSKLIEAGNQTASDYGLKYAVITAGAERAQSAQPYGSPAGATELTAYDFELAGAQGEGSANAKRGLAAVVLLAGAAGVTAIRRRGLI